MCIRDSLQPVAAPRRRSSDTEFPSTRPMVRSAMSPPVPPVAVPEPPRKAVAQDATMARRLNERAARPGVMRLTDFGGLEEMPAAISRTPAPRPATSPSAPAAAPVVQRGDLLLVSESLVEGRILHKRFKKYGLSIDWSREGKQALVMMKSHAYRMVAVDRLNGEPDAYQICRAAKQTRQPLSLIHI